MAIELMSGPLGQAYETVGPLTLPASFDRKLYAAKWVKKGPAVAAAAEREWIPGTRLSADGWLVWKDGETPTTGKPYTVHLSSGEHVLLFRLREIQDAVNAICGNIGKERLLQEKRGETTGGVPIADPGMLSDDRLTKVIGKEELGDGEVTMNKIPNVGRQRVEVPPLEVG